MFRLKVTGGSEVSRCRLNVNEVVVRGVLGVLPEGCLLHNCVCKLNPAGCQICECL